MTLSDDASLEHLSQLVRARAVSPVEIVRHSLARIRDLDPELSAWVRVDGQDALTQAAALERELQQGRWRGPMHGIPVGVKDIMATRGLATTMGSPIFAGHVPANDAAVVARLREAGAVVLGKTVTTEFATLDPGPTRNPWNREHTPGGSSSGSAAAVAAGLCPVATGTQTVGSVGRPAAFCGVVGLMPTAARIPTEGIFPVSWSLDHVGGFAGSVGDVRLFAESMCGVRFRIPKRPDPPRIGVVGEFFETHTARGAWERHTDLVRKLEEQAVVVKLRLPEVFGVALPAHWTIMRSELGAVHERLHERHAAVYGDRLRGFVESGMLVPARDYIRALRVRRLFQRRMRDLFSSCDVVLTPGATGPAPRGLETTGDPVLSAPWTLADCPTLSMPLCLHDGLPLGIQLTAPPMEEARLLAAGLWLERRIAFRDRPTVRSAM